MRVGVMGLSKLTQLTQLTQGLTDNVCINACLRVRGQNRSAVHQVALEGLAPLMERALGQICSTFLDDGWDSHTTCMHEAARVNDDRPHI